MTKKALYAARANRDWISIGKTLHEAGHARLASEAVGLFALWSEVMQPYAPESLAAALQVEQELVAKLRAQVPGDLRVRGFGSSLSTVLERIERHSEDATKGRSPSIAAQIRDVRREAAARTGDGQRDRKAYRRWATDPAEYEEEIHDRQLQRPEEQRPLQGLETPL